MLETLFWLAVVALAYTYLGYPTLIASCACVRTRPVRRTPIDPSVTIVVVAHNEAGRIGRRLDNLLALDFPSDRRQIIVASDGSTDATVERASGFTSAGVEVIDFRSRRGKAAVLNDVIPRARGDIVVLADARQSFEKSALTALVAPFADARVGAVSGELMLTVDGAPSGGAAVGVYWRYEKLIRRLESRVDSTLGATGAIYAIRRRLFVPMPSDTLLDDVLIPARIVRQGYRVVFEPDARAWDRVAPPASEFRRKVRTIAGNFQLFARERWLLDPRANRLWWQAVSHKGLRLASPLFLLVAVASNAALAAGPGYLAILVAQTALYGAAAAGFVSQRLGSRVGILGVPYVFCLLNWATVVAFARFLTGRQSAAWDSAAS